MAMCFCRSRTTQTGWRSWTTQTGWCSSTTHKGFLLLFSPFRRISSINTEPPRRGGGYEPPRRSWLNPHFPDDFSDYEADNGNPGFGPVGETKSGEPHTLADQRGGRDVTISHHCELGLSSGSTQLGEQSDWNCAMKRQQRWDAR